MLFVGSLWSCNMSANSSQQRPDVDVIIWTHTNESFVIRDKNKKVKRVDNGRHVDSCVHTPCSRQVSFELSQHRFLSLKHFSSPDK